MIALLHAGTASANCPPPWNEDEGGPIDCYIDAALVCSEDDANTWSCSIAGAAAGGSQLVITDSYYTGTTYEAWGDIDGEKFCCVAQDCYTTFHAHGSAQADLIEFSWDRPNHQLGPATGCQGNITAYAWGEGGQDMIYGSDSTVNYEELLYGGDGADTISGLDGHDHIYGGANPDTLDGGAGADVMEGGTESDTMRGGAGDDTMDGNDHNDFMAGGSGDDTMDGGSGADVMCGDDHTNGDTLYDGDSTDEDPQADVLYGFSSVDEVECRDDSTVWDGGSEDGDSCEGNPTISSRPTYCP